MRLSERAHSGSAGEASPRNKAVTAQALCADVHRGPGQASRVVQQNAKAGPKIAEARSIKSMPKR